VPLSSVVCECGKPPYPLYSTIKLVKSRYTHSIEFLVNEDIPQDKRRIPFKNIVYVGDGMTDIPCFSTVKLFGGQAFGVFDPSNPEKTKQAMQKFLVPRRVIGMYEPHYGRSHALGALLRMWITNRAAEIQVNSAGGGKATRRRKDCPPELSKEGTSLSAHSRSPRENCCLKQHSQRWDRNRSHT
jgi:hypothetical protein